MSCSARSWRRASLSPPCSQYAPLKRQFAPERLLDHVECVSEFAEFDQQPILKPQEIRNPETQTASGRALQETDIRHDRGAVAVDADDLALVACDVVALRDLGHDLQHGGGAVARSCRMSVSCNARPDAVCV